MNAPRISALIPAYNAAAFLADALDSVFAQTHPVDEVIVLNDGSTDDTAAVAARYAGRIRYAEQPHAGIRVGREWLVQEARGEWLAFLDADDIWYADKTARQLAVIAGEPDLEFLHGHMIRFRDEPTGRVFHPPEPAPLVSASLLRRSAVEKYGGFSGSDDVGEFFDWMVRARERGLRERCMPETVVWRRVHGGNIGVRDREAEQRSYLHTVRAALARRRNSAP